MPDPADISIHALREEGDAKATEPGETVRHFYPRPPRGGRHESGHPDQRHDTDFYPRPPRGGRPEIDSYLEETKLISIHALREEGDQDGSWSSHSEA